MIENKKQTLLLGTWNSNCLQSVRGEGEEFLKYAFILRQLEDTFPILLVLINLSFGGLLDLLE